MSPESVLKKPKAPSTAHEARLEQVLARFLQRDEEHHSAWQAVTAKQADHGRLLEAVQVEVQRMSRTLEAQAGINERQIKLQETIGTHGETFSRLFQELHELRAELKRVEEKRSHEFSQWRDRHETENAGTRESVAQGRGAVRLLTVIGGVIIALISTIFVTTTSGLQAAIDKHDIKLDTLTQDVMEVRMARERDQEKEPKP